MSEGIRLRPGQRRKSIKRKKSSAKPHDHHTDETTFADFSLKPDRHILARKFSHLCYGNYKNQFLKSAEPLEDADTSRESFELSASTFRSLGPPSEYMISDVSAIIYDTETVGTDELKVPVGDPKPNNDVNSVSKADEDGNVIFSDIVTEFQPSDTKPDNKTTNDYFLNDSTFLQAVPNYNKHYSLHVHINERRDSVPQRFEEAGSRDSNTSKGTDYRQGADTGDTFPADDDGGDNGEGQFVELQVEGVRKASIKLPPINLKTFGRRQTEINLVSRKQTLEAVGHENTFSSGESLREATFYRSEIASSVSSEISLSFVPSDSSSDDDGESGLLNITDSDEFDTDLEVDIVVEDRIPDADAHVGRVVYLRMCESLGKPPQKYILRSLPERAMTLRNRSLGKDGIAPLCAALKDNLRVERINLDGTDITDDGITYVTDMLQENITISHLSLANNSLGLKSAQLINHVLTTTRYLSHLNLSGNKLKDDSAFCISNGMTASSSLTHLDLGYNDIGERGGIFISSGLVRNSKIVYLSLRWNKIRGKGAVAIFQALALNKSLEVLDVSWNGMGYDGAVAMSKCLKSNRTLRTLDVSSNRLAHSCTLLVAEGLKVNHNIKQLKVACNPLTTTGCMDLLEAVASEESSVNFLDCSEIPVLGEADLLAATISRRRKFLFIHGGIVPTADKIGQKMGRELNPMLRIIDYLRLLGLRPLELLKSFDKTTTSFELPRQEFVTQMKKIGVKLHAFEIEALANSISGKGYNKNVINYRKLSMAVREVVREERERKLHEKEEWLQMKKQHEQILKRTQLEIDSNTSPARGLSAIDSLHVASYNTSSLMATSRDSIASSKASGGAGGISELPNPSTSTPPEPPGRRVSFAVPKRKPPQKKPAMPRKAAAKKS